MKLNGRHIARTRDPCRAQSAVKEMQWQVVIFCSFPAHQCADRVLRAMAYDGGPSLTRISRTHRACLNALKPYSKPHRESHPLSVIRHRLLGSRPHELPEPETRYDLALRSSAIYGRICAPAGLRRGNFGDSWGEGARLSDTYPPEFGQAAQDQSRAGMQNETATASQRRCRDTQGYGQRQASALLFVTPSAHWPASSSHGRLGVDVCISGSQKGLMLPPASRDLRQPKGARGGQAATSRAATSTTRIWWLERFRLFSLHSVDSHAVRPA